MDIVACIKKYLLDKYEILYMQGIKVEQNEDVYTLTMDLNNSDRPLYISGQFDTDQEFLNFIYKEMDNRKLFLAEYYILKMEVAPEDRYEEQLLQDGKLIRI